MQMNPRDLLINVELVPSGFGPPHRVIAITHMPTGLTSRSGMQRSDHGNREVALNALKEKLKTYTPPYLPIAIDTEYSMTMTEVAMMLEFEIKWHEDVRDNSHNDFDRRWKDGQISVLQRMVNDIDGIKEPSVVDQIMDMMEEIENEMR